MIPREGTTDELRPGMYLKAPGGKVWRVDMVAPTTFGLTAADGSRTTLERPWKAKPCTILEPTESEALATVVGRLDAEVEAEREPGKPWHVVGLGNDLRQWHTHMQMFHGIHTSTGPGSRSIEKVRAAHELDHEDYEAGHPTGSYVPHTH